MTLGEYTQDELLHVLARDSDFDTRDTIPAPAFTHDTIPCGPPDTEPDSAPVVDADDWCDGWLPPRECA